MGSRGFRLLGRLTSDLILNSPQYLNPCNDYEIDLRGNRIAIIENLAVTEDQFDSIDLSENSIVRLEGFPRLLRLRILFLNNNQINRISLGLESHIPNLEMLILAGNNIEKLKDLDHLCLLESLKYLSLIGNPISKMKDYRHHVISRCKYLKWLDYIKVSLKEREQAEKNYIVGSNITLSNF